MDSPESLIQMNLWNESEDNDDPQTQRRRERCTCGAWRCSGGEGGRGPREKEREKALRRAINGGDAAQVAALLMGAGCWPDRVLERVVKAATCEDVVRVFASAVPNFFWERAGGANALLYGASNGRTELVRALLAVGVAADADASDPRVKALPSACYRGHAPCAELLLEHGADPKQRERCGASVLHVAAEGGEAACVASLLRWGAEVEVTDDEGTTPLHCAARRGSSQCIRALLDAGANPSAADVRGNTPLHCVYGLSFRFGSHVIRRLSRTSSRIQNSNYPECVEELAKRGADVNAVNDENYTPLSCAIAEEEVEILRSLIDNGADLQHRKRGGMTVLHQAVRAHSTAACVEVLLQQPGCPHVDTLDDAGDTPLLAAVKWGYRKGVEELLRFGADVAARDAEGYTALHCAVMRSCWEDVTALIGARADVRAATTGDALTALHLAAGLSDEKILVTLLGSGAEINARAANGRTPLHFAPQVRSNDSLELLLAQGADLLARDDAGFSVLHCAAEVGAARSIELLAQRGFPLDDLTDDGRTALHVATGTMQVACVSHLLQRLHVDVDAGDAAGRTALHVAARATDEDTTRELLMAGANRLARDDFGDSPADVAVADDIKRLIRRWALAA